MTTGHFLYVNGIGLIALGLLGIFGILGKMSPRGFFHPPGWINWVHLGVGIFILAVAVSPYDRAQATVALGGTIVAGTIGIVGLTLGGYLAKRFKVPELADMSDHWAHFLVGLYLFVAWSFR